MRAILTIALIVLGTSAFAGVKDKDTSYSEGGHAEEDSNYVSGNKRDLEQEERERHYIFSR